MIGVRLKEERERLGYTQPQFAEVAGAKKRTLIDWEKGVSSPTAVQLSALAEVGVDVLYILTGQRNTPNPDSSKEAGAMTPRDKVWLNIGRALPEDDRTRLQAIGDSLLAAHKMSGKSKKQAG